MLSANRIWENLISSASPVAHGSRTHDSAASGRSLPTFVCDALIIDGDLTSSGEICVDGQIDGDVTCQHLIVGSGGRINGNITATFVEVRGRVHGDIRAQNVLLAANGRTEGNIRYKALKVEVGAIFNGDCRYSDATRGEDVSRQGAEPPRAALQAG